MKFSSFACRMAICFAFAFCGCKKSVSDIVSTKSDVSNGANLQIQCISRGITQTGITTIPHPRSRMQSAATGNDIAFINGDRISGTSFNGADVYSTTTGTWTSISFAQKIYNSGVASCNTKIASGGGNFESDAATDLLYLLDIASGQWTTSHLSIARAAPAAAGYGSKMLFAGGCTLKAPAKMFSRVDIYDASTNAWSVANLSVARVSVGAAAANNLIAFAGGHDLDANLFNTVDFYDVPSGAWSQSSLSTARNDVTGIGAGNLLFFAGGYGSGGLSSNICDIYNTTLKTWSHVHLAHVSGLTVAATLGTKVVFLGSENEVADVYDLCSRGWGSMTLNVPDAPFSAAAAAGGKMLVGNTKMKIYGVAPATF